VKDRLPAAAAIHPGFSPLRCVWSCGIHAAAWSPRSGSCVEVARNLPRTVAVRDSKDPHGPVLTIEPANWRNFIADVKTGRHDLT
jgi:hypothetical protein